MSFSVIFRNRDHTARLQPTGIKLEVQNYSKTVFGGPEKATLIAIGNRESIWEFAEYLRRPCEIVHNERGQKVWWGMVSDVAIQDGGMLHEMSLDSLANRVSVAYTNMSQRATTAWSQDSDSVAEYGKFERRFSQREVTSDSAEQRRDTLLQVYKTPVLQPSFGGGGEALAAATITLRGWHDVYQRLYYQNLLGLEEYTNAGSGQREIGEDDRPIAAQSFEVSSDDGWTATEIWLRIWKVGSPVDDLQVALYSDTGGNEPNVALASAPGLGGADIPTSATWTRFVLDSGVPLGLSTTYWIHISRSGAKDSSNFYFIDANFDMGYEEGVLKLYSTALSAWVGKNMDLNFKVVGTTAVVAQIGDVAGIAVDAGYLAASDLVITSDVLTLIYRNGDFTCWKELLELLEVGTTSDRRLLCEVTPSRIFRVYEEDPITTVEYKIDLAGNLFTTAGQPIPPEDCFVGKWVELLGFVPPTVDTSIITNPSPLFIDEAEYTAADGRWRPIKTRGAREILEFVSEG